MIKWKVVRKLSLGEGTADKGPLNTTVRIQSGSEERYTFIS